MAANDWKTAKENIPDMSDLLEGNVEDDAEMLVFLEDLEFIFTVLPELELRLDQPVRAKFDFERLD